MHFGSPSHLSQTAAAEAKPRYIYSILKPHGIYNLKNTSPRLGLVADPVIEAIARPEFEDGLGTGVHHGGC